MRNSIGGCRGGVLGDLTGRHYVVTGISSGIGAAVGSALLGEGAKVTGVDINRPDVQVDSFFRCDLRSQIAVEGLITGLGRPVHGLCNAAGVPTSKSPRDIMETNFFGLRTLTDLILPLLEDGGSVVNVASCAGTDWQRRSNVIEELLATSGPEEGLQLFDGLGLRSVDAYRLSKECVTFYSLNISSAEVDRGIRVNAVSPGATYTPILDDFYATMDRERLAQLREAAGGREGYPSEIAAPIVFLLSPGASWINGVNLIVDGGAEAAIMLGKLPDRC